MLAAVLDSSNAINLQHILSYPLTQVPISLAHSDGTPLNTEVFTRMLEWQNEETLLEINLPMISASVIDGGIVIHETILQHSDST